MRERYYRMKLAKLWQLMKRFPNRDQKKKFKNVATKVLPQLSFRIINSTPVLLYSVLFSSEPNTGLYPP